MIHRRHLLTGLGAALALPMIARPALAQGKELVPALERDPNAPVLGNAQGDVTLIEFFDYNCHFCRKNTRALAAVTARDKGLRVVMREWPVFGPGSEQAAALALAAWQQRQYWPMHQALMALRGPVDATAAQRVARDLGLDLDRLTRDSQSRAVRDHLAQSERLAGALGLMGTPTFIVGRLIHFGAATESDLREMIAEARG